MDHEEFKRKLTEVADWCIPKTEKETTVTAKRRGRRSKEQEYQELREQIFNEEFQGVNQTIPLMVTDVKRAAVTCEDCGDYCPNGRETEARLHVKNHKRAWRQKCLTCKRWQNPFNGKFELQGAAASVKFNDFMRESKMRYKTKGNQERQRYMTENKTVIETDTETITFYHHLDKKE